MEKVIMFRNDMLLGRFLRFQGAFDESLIHLQRAYDSLSQCKCLSFDGDLRDLSSDYASTLRELEKPLSAENHLRTEIARREQRNISSGSSALKICLAEALFTQERFSEAEALCLEVKSYPGLSRIEKLRLYIILAK